MNHASHHAGHVGHDPGDMHAHPTHAEHAVRPLHAHDGRSNAASSDAAGAGLSRVALLATIHCLTGCAIGEVAGMVLGTALGWGNVETIALSILLAFTFGYALTAVPLLRSGFSAGDAARLALASDTASITMMEIVDNALMWVIPGAMDAPLDSALFWGSLVVSLVIAGAAAFPLNRWLIARGRGHAVVHAHH